VFVARWEDDDVWRASWRARGYDRIADVSVEPVEPQDVRIEPLFDAPALPEFDLPRQLRDSYGRFGIENNVVYANFVASMDGAVALRGVERASPIISGGSAADRFVVGLLRAAADAVVVGAGTFRTHAGPWTPTNASPDFAEAFGALRRALGADVEPALVIVTRSGDLGPPRSLPQPSIVASAGPGTDGLAPYAREGYEILPLADGESASTAVVRALRARGMTRVLTEGGPRLMGEFLRARVVDELYLTLSPLIFGSVDGGTVGLADGVPLGTPPVRAELMSVRRTDNHVFLRYSIDRGA
jgi:riboflavin biosynthesis pyrimidine reductase